MLERHRNELSHILERLVYDSYVHIEKAYLRYIYDTERMGVTSWRNLFDALPDGIKYTDILVHEWNDHVILLSKHHTLPAKDYI